LKAATVHAKVRRARREAGKVIAGVVIAATQHKTDKLRKIVTFVRRTMVFRNKLSVIRPKSNSMA
jgi:hypothetical protein